MSHFNSQTLQKQDNRSEITIMNSPNCPNDLEANLPAEPFYLEEKDPVSQYNYFSFRVRNFSPAWFSGIMGIGVASATLYSFPFQHQGLKYAGMAVWGINVVLFFLFLVMFALRFIIYPDQFKKMLLHPGQSSFLGCLPMGFSTIINVLHLFVMDWNLNGGWQVCYLLWWIDVAISLLSCWGVCYVFFAYQKRPSLDAINATILLPIVPLVVASSTGALVAQSVPESLKGTSLIVSFLLWANGEILAFLCMAVYTCRLFLKNVQPRAIVLSTLLPVGPMGQGAFGILLMGDLYKDVFNPYVNAPSNYHGLVRIHQEGLDTISLFTMAIAMFLIGVGIFWMVMTILFTINTPPPTYNMSWWATTFPIGTVVMAWYRLNSEFNNEAFKYLGALFGCFVLASVSVCVICSIKYAVLDDLVFKQAKSETSADE